MTNRIITKTLSTGFLFFAFAIQASPAMACTNYITNSGGTTQEVPFLKAAITELSIPSFNPGDYAIGQTIYSHEGTVDFIGLIDPKSYCGSPTTVWLAGVGSVGSHQTYPTSISGIGVRLTTVRGTIPQSDAVLVVGAYTRWRLNFKIQFELVKTGDITAQGVLQGPFMYYRENGTTGKALVEFSYSNPVTVTPRVPTCSVANTSQNVRLKSINSLELNGINSTSAQRSDFNIRLNCSGGDPHTATRAFVTLTDGIQPGNVGNILTVQQTGLPAGEKPAQGIGLQILKDETVLGYGPDSSATGNTNQWEAGRINQGQPSLTIPLQARYVQTGSKVTAGKVYARATFTMSYQ